MPMSEAEQIIERFGLEPLEPEGGYFKRTWTGVDRADGSAIYFLLTPATFSAFHRIKADELWHFYAGDPVEHWQLRSGLPALGRRLGSAVLAAGREEPQVIVPALTWQGARLAPASGRFPRGWALLGCTLCPAWRDHDFFELGGKTELATAFPESAELISSLTR